MTVFSDFLTGLMNHMNVDQTQLAERIGVAQPTVSRWFKGSEPRQEALRRVQELAQEVGFMSEGVDTLPLVAVPIKPGLTSVQIRSYVGAGAEIHKIEGANSVLDHIELPWLSGTDYEAVIVRGNSMFPVYRNDDLLIFKAYNDDIRRLLNRECVVELEDGRRFVKVLRPGSSPSLFNLESYNPHDPTIADVSIRQAIPIEFVRRSTSPV